MAATNTNTQNLSSLVINKVDSKQTFQQMVTNNLVNPNELYLVQSELENSMETLTIGPYTYDGSSAVNIPVYDGTYTWG